MKYLKNFEISKYAVYNKNDRKIFIIELINNDVKLKIVFVDDITKSWDTYHIRSENVIQINQWQDGTTSLNIRSLYTDYTIEEFEKIDLISVEEFYKKYEDLYVGILEELIDRIKKPHSGEYIAQMQELINLLTIPETEPIINQNKYNL
jgi:hypoxanthine phosphoribosyltransferase